MTQKETLHIHSWYLLSTWYWFFVLFFCLTRFIVNKLEILEMRQISWKFKSEVRLVPCTSAITKIHLCSQHLVNTFKLKKKKKDARRGWKLVDNLWTIYNGREWGEVGGRGGGGLWYLVVPCIEGYLPEPGTRGTHDTWPTQGPAAPGRWDRHSPR